MELKSDKTEPHHDPAFSFNRTAYGIEIQKHRKTVVNGY